MKYKQDLEILVRIEQKNARKVKFMQHKKQCLWLSRYKKIYNYNQIK